jgi:hypothetical protein
MRAVAAAVAFVSLAVLQGPARPAAHGAAAGRQSIPSIYSRRVDDPWNRVFALLFTRSFQTRFTDEFAGRGPFELQREPLGAPAARVSTRTFDRFEDGDRAVDALYPAFLNLIGPREALHQPRFADVTNALNDALADRTVRTPLARALMQIDLWSAHDPLAMIASAPHQDPEEKARAAELSALLAKMIGRIALTPAEVAALPDNYEAARRSTPLPDLFRRGGEWLEVAWAQFHMHDADAAQRRFARVYMRPVSRPPDIAVFLRIATREFPQTSFSAVALVMRAMVVDSRGHVAATPIASDVQIRAFTRAGGGTLLSTASTEYELSRRRILSDPASGGFLTFDDRSDAYLAVAGNDYGFATPAMGPPGETQPTIGTLRARCRQCHGGDGAHIMSFAVQDPERLPAPRALPQPNDDRARAVAREKEARDDFKRLLAAAGLPR